MSIRNFLELSQYLEEYLNISPQFWYFFQDDSNELLNTLYNQNLVIKENCFVCQFLTDNILNTCIYQVDGGIFTGMFELISSDGLTIVDKNEVILIAN